MVEPKPEKNDKQTPEPNKSRKLDVKVLKIRSGVRVGMAFPPPCRP